MNAKKLLLATLAATTLASCKDQVSSNVLNYAVPEEAVSCRAGDYVIRSMGTNSWKVFRIERVVLVSPLLPIAPDRFIEEIDLRQGGAVPEGWGQIHLITTLFERNYETEEQALSSIKARELGDSVEGLCRNAKFFLKVNSKVYKE